MQVALLAVVEVGVGLPDAREHRDREGQGLLAALVEGQPAVDPRLTEVAVHRVRLYGNSEE